MRLLQKSLRSMIIYSLLLVVLSIPVSLLAINYIVKKEVDEMLLLYRNDFIEHLGQFEYLEDLETDLRVLDDVVYEIDIKTTDDTPFEDFYATVYEFDSVQNITHPFKTLTSKIKIKDRPYLLTIRLSLINNNDLVITLGAVQVILALLLALGLVFINRALSKKIWKPFYKTLSELKEYELDKHKELDFEPTDIVEFNDLNTAVGYLTDKNRKIFLHQRELIENMSHEMQTPLAILQSKVDMLMQRPELNEDQSQLIQDLVASMQRLAKLNKNMLLLSKIENEQFSEQESFDIGASIYTLVNNLRPMADTRNISFHYEPKREMITANKMLVEILLSNLLTNAIRYNLPSGQVLINHSPHYLSIRNTGKPLTFPAEKLFDRFVKGTHQQGTGLGLAIVKKICDACGYGINYTYENGMHLFTIDFKS